MPSGDLLGQGGVAKRASLPSGDLLGPGGGAGGLGTVRFDSVNITNQYEEEEEEEESSEFDSERDAESVSE